MKELVDMEEECRRANKKMLYKLQRHIKKSDTSRYSKRNRGLCIWAL